MQMECFPWTRPVRILVLWRVKTVG